MTNSKKDNASESEQKNNANLITKAKTAGMVLTGIFAIKVAIDEMNREWTRSKQLISKMKEDYKESTSATKEMEFPAIEESKKAIIQSRLIIFFYLYASLLIILPIALWQSFSHGFYSPALGAIGFSCVAIAKMAEYSFFSYQVRINRFASFKEWYANPKFWIPTKK